ncbi:quinone oxidoreductase [Sandaracinobacter neustonicus]|uniref:Quinone oxidoreductase n=1 Tax=Sandaracinobacter neustonicus TaxID=1715348 RepID=A0A501XQP6_9SPHN|nr:quinone oxidoreductase [Sandaracinobacter neustonicus]TPE62870.1 quinone oxidoreductase [Sandaracinobacter neustonicus]
MKAIRFAETGGPQVMKLLDVEVGEPGPGQARVRHSVIGVNFIDTYHRSGLYPMQLPSGLGMEAAGVVEAVGEGVSHVSVGDRVIYFANPPGAYATHRLMDARPLVKLPDSVSDEQAAALWLKACTVESLVERCARVQPGQTVLVPAAAGGVGVLLCQWLKSKDVTVIGTVGSPAKVDIARAAGADHVLSYEEVPARVREITGGKGVDAAIDGVGKSTFDSSLDSLKRRGILASFGNASGPAAPLDIGLLARKGSLFVTRPTLFDYYATPEDFAAGTAAVFAKIASGVLKAHIGQSFALADAVAAHKALEARQTVGSSLLIP